MKEYFITVMVSSVVSALCVSLSSGTGTEKYVRYVCALVCASVIVFPVTGLFDYRFPDVDVSLPETAASSVPVQPYGVAESYAESGVKEYVSSLLLEKFGIIPVDISIEIDIGNGITVGEMTVILEKSDEGRRKEAEDFLRSFLGSGIKVVTDE